MPFDFNQLVLEEMQDGIIITDPEGRVLHWTKGAEQLFGFSATEALGRKLDELITPRDRIEEENRILKETIANGVCYYESLRRTKRGSLIYVDISSKTICNERGETQYILSSKKDVTHLKAMRDAKLLDAKFRDLLESMPDSIVMANLTGRIVLANSQAEKLFGYASGALRGKLIEILLPERFRNSHVGHRSDYFGQPRTREMGAGLDLYGLRSDGTEFPVEISLSPLPTEEGTFAMSAIRDISERKQIERTLRDKNIELEAASLAKDRFLASMSHELRTPLNAIIGFTGTLLMKLPGPLTADQGKQLRTIQSSARHLLSLINDLLDLVKIESGKIELNPEPVVCQDVIRDLTETLGTLADKKRLWFKLDLPPADVMVMTDRRALSQILINLVNNAIKFTDEGGVTISLREHLIGGRWRTEISVADTGSGIKPEEQAMLFQAFAQLDATSTRRFEGTGLGLYLSQKLAELIDGKLEIQSEFGKGSTFTLALEAVRAA
jgi:PAS domain S-box-containing protein